MKQLLSTLAFIVFIPCALAVSQTLQDGALSEKMPDGRYWLKLDTHAKAEFIQGIQTGLKFYNMDADTSITPFAVDSIVMQFNLVYSDTANIRIPVTSIYQYSIDKLSGESFEVLQRRLSFWRQGW